MKKIIFCILMVILISPLSVYASCTTTSGTIEYATNTAPPAKINYQTGVGYCNPSINPNGVVLDLTKCENVNDIIVGEDYLIAIKIDTEGFEFVIPTAATPVSYAISAYSSYDDLCKHENGINLNIKYSYADGETNNIISEVRNDLVYSNYPYFLIEIPDFTYKSSAIDISDVVLVTVGFVDADSICVTCGNAICKKTYNLGKISCVDSYTVIFPYALVHQDGWWTGIAVTNLTNANGSYKISVFTPTNIYIQNKDIEKYQVDTFLVDDIVNKNYEGTCWVKIESNFSLDGICFFGDNVGHSCYKGSK